MQKTILLLILLTSSFVVNAQLVNLQSCKAQPAFIIKKGFDAKRTVISTSEKHYPSLVMYQLPDTTVNKDAKPTYHQDASWKKYGTMGTLCFDEKGNIYVIPIPWVNVLTNAKKNQNTIYKVDGVTGIMSPFFQLPTTQKYNPQNAFGLLGISYDCSSKMLYVSTVISSDRTNEKGTIYCIDTKSKLPSIKDSIQGKDILGLGIISLNKQKILLTGSARNSTVYAVYIDSVGRFLNKKFVPYLSIQNLGTRGDDKVRKFEISNNQIIAKAVEFNWNLTAPTEQQQTVYTFRFNTNATKFELIDIQSYEGLQKFTE
jgi:hypothetical protein